LSPVCWAKFAKADLLKPHLLLPVLALFCSLASPAQPGTADHLPHIDHSGAHPALIIDGKPFLMLGAQMNNSSAWPASMPAVWSTMDKLGVNTVEAPIYWESFEPREGTFDFSQVDMLLAQAREHRKHLVLLWFATWKNGSPGYAPEWVKRDWTRFPLARKEDGTALFSLSPFAEPTLAADRKAFIALMQHLKTLDTQQTVLMIQVENEAGLWGAMRDHSPDANRIFLQPVPEKVLDAMGKRGAHGSWSEVFGTDAEEFFSAWAIAQYIQQIAAAGKAIYPLPMYANAALRDPIHPGGPLSFESGGPTFDVLPLWHAVAPSLDGLEPDIYMPEYDKHMAVLTQYALPWNAFFVPELGNSAVYARYFFAALGKGAFGWSPFGMDATGYVNYPLGAARIDDEALEPYIWNYRIAAPMAGELAAWVRNDQVRGVAEAPEKHTEDVDFSNVGGVAPRWKATVSFGLPTFWSDKPAPGNPQLQGEALLVQLGPDEFLVTGAHCRIDFTALAAAGAKQRMWISVEEGSYLNGEWRRTRLWNGDQTDYGLNFTNMPQLLRVRLAAY
jgi:beta-galactosidase GanA